MGESFAKFRALVVNGQLSFLPAEAHSPCAGRLRACQGLACLEVGYSHGGAPELKGRKGIASEEEGGGGGGGTAPKGNNASPGWYVVVLLVAVKTY